MKFSIIIPYYDPQYLKTELFTACLKSVVESSQGQDYEIVIVKDGPSYTESHNRGLKAAKGEYLVVINDDVVIKDSEWLTKLQFDEGISSFRTGTWQDYVIPNAWCFCMSRQWYEKLGGFDEVYKDGINYEDIDYFLKALDQGAKIKDAGIQLGSRGGSTWSTYYNDNKDLLIAHNQKIFTERWKL